MHPPFVILALPRSRTAWLSKFLTYGGFVCGHDELRHMRSLADVRSWLSQPMTGSVETLAVPYWRLLAKLAPEARIVIVRRPAAEVAGDILKIETFGAGEFGRDRLTQALHRLEAKLFQAAKRLPNVLDVNFADLEREEACAAVFEHCLPYKHDRAWWSYLAPIRIDCEFHARMRYAQAFAPQLFKLAETAAFQMRSDLALRRQAPPEGMTFQEESFETWRRDGLHLFEKHCVEAGEAPSSHSGKNWDLMEKCAAAGHMQIVTARSNGRMFGYLMTVLAPSMEMPGRRAAIHTSFFADPAARGIGLKLQRFALERLEERGIDEVFFRAGPQGSGLKMGALYRRLGAQPDGEIYRLTFSEAA